MTRTNRTATLLLCLATLALPISTAGIPTVETLTDEIPSAAPEIHTWWNGEPYFVTTPEPPVGDNVDRAPITRELLEPTLVTDHAPGTPPALDQLTSADLAYANQKNGIRGEPATDTRYLNGVWSTISITQATNIGNGHFSSWPGMYLSNGDFVQVGYETIKNPTTGLPQLVVFAQVWKSGYGSRTCGDTTGYVYCWTWSGLISAGQTHAFYLKNGVNGNAYDWGFFLNSDSNMLNHIVLGATNSGTNTAYALNERAGSPPTAVITSNTWDCGLCQLKSGIWSTPSHVLYYTQGLPPCPPMGFTLSYTNEFRMGSLEGCTYSSGQRVW